MKRNEQSTVQQWINASFKGMLRFQWKKIMVDRRTPLLWIVEILLAVGIAISVGLYLDPDVNVIPAPWNYVAFSILAGVALLTYRRTRPFRVSRKIKNQMTK